MIKKIIIIFLIIFLSSFFFFYFYNRKNYKKILIGNTKVLVEIVETQEKMEKGLSERVFLPERDGMLFLFKEPDFHPFWMKDMKFPLDFIWILKDEVVDISENIKPEDYQPPKVLFPKEKVDKVLEVNAGFIKKFQIKIGDKVILK